MGVGPTTDLPRDSLFILLHPWMQILIMRWRNNSDNLVMQLLHVVSFGLSLHAVASGDKRCTPLRVGIWELIVHPPRSARRHYLDHRSSS